MHTPRLALAGAVFVVASCGGGGNGGTNPPPPSQVLDRIVVSPGTFAIETGESQQLTATARDAQGGTIVGASGYTYSSNSTTVASVSGSGLVTGVGAGQSTITVSLTRDGVTKTATSTATVSIPGPAPQTADVAAGNGETFSPNRVVVAIGGTVTWTFAATQHNVNFRGAQGAPANIPNTSVNQVVARTFPSAGTFDYDCTLHSGMSGRVVVR
jgi:plastocyanin